MNEEGNTLQGDDIQQGPQALDFVVVKYQKKNRRKRPNLSETLEDKAKESIVKQLKEEDENRDPQKTERKEKEMTEQERDKVIAAMLAKSNSTVGVAPINNKTIDNAMTNMTRRGVYNKDENYDQR